MPARRNPGTTAAILAAVALVTIGTIFAVTQLRPDPETPEAAPTTTTSLVPIPTVPATTTTTGPTSFQISQIANGRPFAWRQTLVIQDDQEPLALVDHDATTFLFTTGRVDDQVTYHRLGLKTWASADGENWSELGSIDTDHVIWSVISTRFGLIASGWDPNTGDGLIWRSENGSNWDPTVVASSLGPETRRWFGAATASEGTIFITTRVARDDSVNRRLVRQALSDHFGEGDFENAFWFRNQENDQVGIIFLTDGAPPETITPGEIGIDPSVLEDEHPDPSTPWLWNLWISHDGVNWTQHNDTPGGNSPKTLFAGPDGRIWAFRAIPGEEEWLPIVGIFATTDGVDWEMVGPDINAWDIQQWPDGLIGRVGFTPDQIALSTDGSDWRSLFVGNLLSFDVGWAVAALGGGPDGLAVVAAIAPTFNEPDPSPGQAFLFANSNDWPTSGVLELGRLPRDWTIQDLAPTTSDPITHLLVRDGRVVLVSSGEGGLAIHVGVIPR